MPTDYTAELIAQLSATNERQHREIMRLFDRNIELTRWKDEQDRSDLERVAVVKALKAWAEEGGDPWMSFCADRIERGEHRREEER